MSADPALRSPTVHTVCSLKRGRPLLLFKELTVVCVCVLLVLCWIDSDYENANRSADVDVELMAFQSIIGDDYKGH